MLELLIFIIVHLFFILVFIHITCKSLQDIYEENGLYPLLIQLEILKEARRHYIHYNDSQEGLCSYILNAQDKLYNFKVPAVRCYSYYDYATAVLHFNANLNCQGDFWWELTEENIKVRTAFLDYCISETEKQIKLHGYIPCFIRKWITLI